MAKNPNGKNEIKIDFPCCDDDELSIVFKTNDNKTPVEVLKLLGNRLGVGITITEPKKGGGD